MNSITSYIILLIGILLSIAIIFLFLRRTQNNNGIKFSKIINKEDAESTNLSDAEDNITKEEINEIRVPKQGELYLPD